MTTENSVRVLFRHQNGDLGPLFLPQNTTIAQVKEQVLSELPSANLVVEPPKSVASIILIKDGKYTEDGRMLEAYRFDLGEARPDQTLIMHLVIRSTPPKKPDPGEPGKCCCAIQ